MKSEENVFDRNRPLFLFLIGLVIVCLVVYLLREPLIPFLIGFLIAYLLLPIVDWVDSRLPFKGKGHDAQRITVIIVTFLIILALLAGLSFLMVATIGGSFATFLSSAPTLITQGLDALGKWFTSLLSYLSPEQQEQAQNLINNIGQATGKWLQDAFSSGLAKVPATFSFILGFFTLPFFLIFFMQKIQDISNGFFGLLSSELARHFKAFFNMADNILGRYIRASLLTGVVMGVIICIVLLLLGINVAPALGLIAALFQLIPLFGPPIAAIIGIVVTLAIAPSQVLWVTIAYVLINVIVGSVLVARFQGSAMKIDASIVMILIVVGGFLGGVIGMIFITPVVAILYDLYKYVRNELRTQAEEMPQA